MCSACGADTEAVAGEASAAADRTNRKRKIRADKIHAYVKIEKRDAKPKSAGSGGERDPVN